MHALRSWLFFFLCSVCGGLALWLPPAHAARANTAVLIEIDGAIGPATSLYYDYAAKEAEARGARLILLQLDTPGGLDQPMREIIKRILASKIPVVTYVAPAGARAASAGTYILYASHVAAMAPATNLGAATPIPVMGNEPQAPSPEAGNGQREKEKPPDKGGKENAEAPRPPSGGAASRKAVNDATAYLRSLAEKRGRNADWAEQAVREGASLSAEAALKLKVIDLIATDRQQLLTQLHGRRIALGEREVTLETRDLVVDAIAPTWRQSVLAVLTNPTVAYLLMLIGIYGLLLEGYSPGAILPGVVGGICLLLALYAFQILPINYAGLALILLGVALIVAETVVPSVGILGGGGVIAFVAGSLLLLDTNVPGYEIPLGLIAGIATLASLLVLLSLTLLLRNARRPAVQAQAGLAQAEATALEDFSGAGWVEVQGERWRAQSDTPVQRGQRLRVTGVQNLTLTVEPVAVTPAARAQEEGQG
jgi:membrane-bound serine protease (ClpP class)